MQLQWWQAAGMIALGVVVGVGASFTGLGGGFLMVPLLIFMGSTPQRAVGTSFLGILIISVSALVAHGRLEHVDYRLGLLLGLGGVVGAQFGARWLEGVSAPVFNKLFAFVLAALALRLFFHR